MSGDTNHSEHFHELGHTSAVNFPLRSCDGKKAAGPLRYRVETSHITAMELVQRQSKVRWDLSIALAAAPAMGLLAAKFIKVLVFRKDIHTRPTIYRAPRPQAATPEKDEYLPYPNDALPGSRDIETPFGVTRAYEFGPENGRKVLLVHGISTPCLAMAPLAKLLSDNGCRVCCYDLPGRGYSDSPSPSVYRQDFALFSSQIFAVIASSPLDWAGEGFTLVGYSLGGGISMCFASYFPNLVKSLVLFAPSGVIRSGRMTPFSQFLYGGWLPNALVERLVTLRMKLYGGEPQMRTSKVSNDIDVTDTVADETPDPTTTQGGCIELFHGVRAFPSQAVSWQIDHHPGFVPSFVSSLRFGPTYDCHERLKIIGRRCETSRSGLVEGKVLVVVGVQDSIVLADDTANDIRHALGERHVDVVRLPGGHDLIITDSKGCLDAMLKFWGGA